jgi:hypothetical protein
MDKENITQPQKKKKKEMMSFFRNVAGTGDHAE